MDRFDIRWCTRNLPKTYTDILNLAPECKDDKCNINYNICLYISKVPIYQPYKKGKFDFTTEERDNVIKDLREQIHKEMINNQIKENESWRLASKFIYR